MATPDRALGIGVLAVLGIGASFGAWRLHQIELRMGRTESAPRVDPAQIEKLAGHLQEIEARVGESLCGIEELRREGEITRDLDRRLAELQGGFEEAAVSIAEQRKRIEAWSELEDKIGPRALDARMEEYRRGSEEHWRRIDEETRTAREMAETTRNDLGLIEKDLVRDEERMWQDLVAPSVQVMGDESVGSGVLLRCDPTPSGPGFRTYVLTAWHVIRDLQTSPEDLSFPVQVTIFGKDRGTSIESATVVKYDVGVDVALLVLETKREIEWQAKLASRTRLERVRTFDRVYAVGCPLGNEPIPTFGEIADKYHVVDGSSYWMISAPTYIGNSGGGIFDAKSHELLGIFSKIYTHGTLRPTVIPHMGLATSLATIYDWLERAGYAHLEAPEESSQVQAAAARR